MSATNLLQLTAALSMTIVSPAGGREIVWEALPTLPDPVGVAGAFAGSCDGMLLVAGGANFPTLPLAEGGKKAWHDRVWMLAPGADTWQDAGRLPHPLGYGVSVDVPGGVLCIGGSDENRHHKACFLLKIADGRAITESWPALPVALANMAGAKVGRLVMVAGGTHDANDTVASKAVYLLDLDARERGWQKTADLPGDGRILPVAATIGDGFFIISGASLSPDAAGKPARKYLTDTWKFTRAGGWQRVADVPVPVVAAASPAAALGDDGFAILGGDDGTKAGFKPATAHPGFSRALLGYDAGADTWTELGKLPDTHMAPVTTSAVVWQGKHVVPSGEYRPGIRTPQVVGWQLASDR